MSDHSASNKRIAKNTLFLYVRMGLSILVNLYTVRVIWQVLGIDNYGIYNLVGGIVLMFQFLNSAMVVSSQRFISFELGKGNLDKLRKVFSISVTVHYLLAGAILLLAETLGLWFLNAKLNIPPDRMVAANWVYQCSILAFLVTVISVPYNACIVAHEHMKAYGYFGILEVLLKLGIVFLLMVIPFDKLITYAVLVLIVQVSIRIIYQIYCRRHFPECHYNYTRDPHLMRDMFSFAGWSFLGNMGFSVRDQGLNILINMFFNVAMNAAKGIAFQVANVIRNFSTNFQMALNPQITKLYATGEIDRMLLLLSRGCKFSFLLVMIIAVPLYFKAEYVLQLWLGNVDSNMVVFLQLSLITVLIESVVTPIVTTLQATGNIRRFQIIISIIMILNIPAAWIWLKIDLNPYSVMWVTIITSLIGIVARLVLLKEQIGFSLKWFIRITCQPLIVPFILTTIPLYFLSSIFDKNTIANLVLFVGCTLILSTGSIYVFGLTKRERNVINDILKTKFTPKKDR